MGKTKLYKIANRIIGILIGAIALFYIIQLFTQKTIVVDWWELLVKIKANFQWLALVFLLMIMNWSLETIKWRYIIKRFEILGFWLSLKSILFGITMSIITPNRIGEIAGRLIYIKKENRVKGLHANSFSAVSQLLTTVLFGLIAFHFLEYRIIQSPFQEMLLMVLICVLIIAFFASNNLLRILNFASDKLNWNQNLPIKLSTGLRLNVLLISIIRYLVFSLQYLILLKMFGSELEVITALILVSLTFFISTVIPTAWISDLPVRTTVAYWLFETYAGIGSIGLLASILLWIVNLFIPSIAGLMMLNRMNWLKIKSYSI